ncbi:MAG TPA: NfeD family protein [Alphaproteobacteria bacterium]|nr:NfeD family protein [Alphaproteobacteria bacterium]
MQVRVMRNAVIWSILCATGLGLLYSRLWEHRDALLLGLTLGGLYGFYHWRRLSGSIARRDRRYARNRIFVHYLDAAEFLLNAVAYHYLLAVLVGAVLAAVVVLSVLSGGWWAVLIGSVGLGRGLVLIGYTLRYERRHGPLYYQYDSRMWSGAEGMLYRDATVVKPLTPEGKVDLQGELWNAVSISGEPIDAGERVEVIAVERLTLYVDRLPA